MNGPRTTSRLATKLARLDGAFPADYPRQAVIEDGRQRHWCSRCGATAVEGEVWQHAADCPANVITGYVKIATTPSTWMIDFDPETLTRHVPARRDLGKRTSPHGDPLSDWENPRAIVPALPPLFRNSTERWCVHCGAHQLASIEGPLPHVADCPALAREEDPAWSGTDWEESPLSRIRPRVAADPTDKFRWTDDELTARSAVTVEPWTIVYVAARDFSGDPQRYWDWIAVENGMGC